MDTSWIQVFVLTLSECVAPAGKTVCQEQEVQYQFVDRQECESALQQLIEYSASSEYIIVNQRRSDCRPMAREQPVFASLDEVNEAVSGNEQLAVLRPDRAMPEGVAANQTAHQRRLEALPECEDVNRRPPCKVGSIIVESDDSEELEVWRRNADQER